MKMNEIREKLKNDGEVTIGNIDITLDSLGNCEICQDGNFLFSATSWWEIEEFLAEELELVPA